MIPEVSLPEIDLLEIEDGVFVTILDGPPEGSAGSGSQAALQLGGDVQSPVGIATPQSR